MFTPGDEIHVSALRLPQAIIALAPLLRPYLSRLLLFRCSAPECGEMVTALYLPRTAVPIIKTLLISPLAFAFLLALSEHIFY
jgi:hypothetical protein